MLLVVPEPVAAWLPEPQAPDHTWGVTLAPLRAALVPASVAVTVRGTWKLGPLLVRVPEVRVTVMALVAWGAWTTRVAVVEWVSVGWMLSVPVMLSGYEAVVVLGAVGPVRVDLHPDAETEVGLNEAPALGAPATERFTVPA